MAFFEFPHTRTYDSDLGWIIKHLGELLQDTAALQAWAGEHKEEYEELKNKVDGLIENLVEPVVPWDSSIAYRIFSIVEYQGMNYIALQDVPVGTMITNTDYWQLANTVVEQVNAISLTVSDMQEEVDNIPKNVYPRRAYFRPEDYGAVVDNPNTDCGPAIKQAILDANAAGGIVLLSEGTYYTSTEIAINEHLYGVHFIGTGDSYLGDRFGTIIDYSGSGQAFRFTNGLWECVFEDLTIKASGAGGGCFYTSSEDDPDLRARCHRTSFNRVSFLYRGTGFTLKNPAYTWFTECRFRGDPDFADNGRIGFLLGDTTDNYNSEYVTLNNCQIANNVMTPNNPSYAVYQTEGVHISFYDVDLIDSDYGWYIKTDNVTGFVNSYNLDIARCKYGVVVDINENSLQDSVFQGTIFTAYDAADVDCRMFLFKRTSGGVGFNAKFKALNNAIRVGHLNMTYWVEEIDKSLSPGSYEFTFLMPDPPKMSFRTRQSNPNYSTLSTLGTLTEDFNNFKTSGFVPYRLDRQSEHSPNFNCMLMVYANPAVSVQIAIPLAITGDNSFAWRIYTESSDSWSDWAFVDKRS